MPVFRFQFFEICHRNKRILFVAVLGLAAVLYGSRQPLKPVEAPTASQTASTPPLVSLLAEARTDAARARLDLNQREMALALAVSALRTDPANASARELTRKILAETTWKFPETTLTHPAAIDHVAFAAPSTLWVSLSGETNTMARWDLASMKIESVLFPIAAPPTRSLVFDAGHQSVVVERGGVTLLCDAMTLRPIREIGNPPPNLTPTSIITFSPDGLLVGHPVLAVAGESTITWHIRDTATGQIIRSSEPAFPEEPRPLAASLDRSALRVLREDGSLWMMPVSSVSPIAVTSPPGKAALVHARFPSDHLSALVLENHGPLSPPTLRSIQPSTGEPSPLAARHFLEAEPWTLQPCLWNGLLRQADSPLSIHDSTVRLGENHTPLIMGNPITAATFSGGRSFIACADGTVSIHREIPPAGDTLVQEPPAAPNPESLVALEGLTEALTGFPRDDTGRNFSKCSPEQRIHAVESCDFTRLSGMFPGLDFQPVIATLRAAKPVTPPLDAVRKLNDRLARASADPADSAALARIETTFLENDPSAILATIESAGAKGPAAAKVLELTLASEHPEWIEACLKQAADLPPLLQKIAFSRIAWLQGRKADALNAWPDGFPDLKQVRLREDWDGWEQADFSKALADLAACMARELAALKLPENPTTEQRKLLFERLSDPATMQTVGRARFARACVDAALVFATFPDDSDNTLKLAGWARTLGEDSVPCLRAEALALTSLGDYQKARDRWVALITEHPAETHLPGDYAEAAYTAFENADPRQAMEILNSGMRRFANDADFALRAGWTALLTGNADRAYQYLLAGSQIGYPPEKIENATALMAIAAVQTGAAEDAARFYQELIGMDPAWEKPETIETLDWPEELKFALRQLIW